MKCMLIGSVVLVLAGAVSAQTNLVMNGDFEAGANGWTTWRAAWGNGETYDFNNTQAGHLGSKCLRLSTTGTSSFGVYQEVPVTPGHSYRIDAYWKGQHFGGSNWYEIILIDGPFSMAQADDGGEPVVRANYMYAYDVNTYPITEDFGWIWAHDQNGIPALDYNNRSGVRTATGNVMTVVLKGGACCGTNGVSAWFDNVSLVDTADTGSGSGSGTIVNGGFSNGLNGWTAWKSRDDNGDFAAVVNDGELAITGSDINGGVYQQIDTGGAGTVVNVIGYWRSDPTLPNAMWAEVLAINGDRTPTDGVDEVDGVNNTVLLYKNDTFGGRGAWNGAIGRTAPVKHRISFVATGPKATLILKAGNNGPNTPTGVIFDDVAIHCVPQPANMANLPPGFAGRTYTFPVSNLVSMAQSPTSRHIYAVSNETNASSTRLYRINVDGGSITTTQISGLGSLLDHAQGMAFDAAGNMYLSNQFGVIIKGVDTNPNPAVDSFSFSQILDLPNPNIGTFHGIGGVAIGPDGMLYINSGSDTHYGPEADGGYNMRILRSSPNGGIGTVTTFSAGIRNSFDIAFRADGKLFGVENGPLGGCDYGEEFNLLEEGEHYGFPYKFGSDLNGSDSSITCTSDGGRVGPQPLPPDLNPRPAWANYGPDGKPGPGQPGYSNGGEYYTFHPHSSPDGLDFYEPALMDPATIKFPQEFHGRAFIARFGNLENVPKVGFDVLTCRLDEAHEGLITNTFLHGFGRVIDVLCAHNGRVYVLEYNQQTEYNGQTGWGAPSRLYEIRYTIATQPQILASVNEISRPVDYGHDLPDDSFTVANSGSGTLDFSVADDQPWLSVSPAAGTSTNAGDEQTITVSYDTADLAIGTHTASITVSDPAAINNPVVIPVSVIVRSVLPDFDKDGDVDMADFGYLQSCLNASGVPPFAGCAAADLDGDADVDQGDLSIFRGCMSGENVPVDFSCDDAWE